MDSKNLRKALQEMATRVRAEKAYRILSFSICEGRTPDKVKTVQLGVLDYDFELDGRTQFSFDEAIEIQNAGREFGLRLLRAHEWRGLGFWINHSGEYYGVTKFNLRHDGHTWEGTDIPQNQNGGAYYWTGSSDKAGDHARAAIFMPSGQFDVTFRPKGEWMNIRLVLDDCFK